MPKNWTVVVNRTKAKIFVDQVGPVNRPVKGLKLIEELKNPLGRERNKALQNSKPSMGRSPTSVGPHSMTGEKNPHEDAAVEFAKKVCLHLEKNQYNKNFEGLVLVAEPHFMGLLKKKMKKKLRDSVVQWVNKDLSKTPMKEILSHLA